MSCHLCSVSSKLGQLCTLSFVFHDLDIFVECSCSPIMILILSAGNPGNAGTVSFHLQMFLSGHALYSMTLSTSQSQLRHVWFPCIFGCRQVGLRQRFAGFSGLEFLVCLGQACPSHSTPPFCAEPGDLTAQFCDPGEMEYKTATLHKGFFPSLLSFSHLMSLIWFQVVSEKL